MDEKNKDGKIKKKDCQLRPDAPTFIPTFSTLNSDTTSPLSDELRRPSEDSNATTKKSRRSQRYRKKTKKDNSRSNEEDKKNKNRQIDDTVYHDKMFPQHQKLQQKTRKRVRNKHSKRRQPTNNDAADDQKTTERSRSKKLLLPIHQEDQFPSLPLASTTSTGQKLGYASTTTTTTWQDSGSKEAILKPPSDSSSSFSKQHVDPQDEFSKLGLERLTATTQSKPKKSYRGTFSSWDDGEVDTSTIDQSNRPGEDTSNSNSRDVNDKKENNGVRQQDITESFIRKRRRQNMTKLRDNWWDALKLRQIRRRFIAELQTTLASIYVEPLTTSTPTPTDIEEEVQARREAATDQGSNNYSSSTDSYAMEQSPLDSMLNEMSINEEEDVSDGIIDKIVQNDNDDALMEYLERDEEDGGATESSLRTLLDRILRLDRAGLLHILLVHLNNSNQYSPFGAEKSVRSSERAQHVAEALMLAGRLGSEHCASTILSRWDNALALFNIKDENGCGVFHHACRPDGAVSVLLLFLRFLSGGTKSKQQQLSKALMMKNSTGQTALHVACDAGRVDFVELFLDVCSTALMAKLLAIEDTESQTPLLAAVGANASDVVMCLIMWRGARNMILRKTPQAPAKQESGPPCPMVWAAKSGNVDMIQLLLQFSDPSGKDYRITESTTALLLSESSPEIKSEGCQLLIGEGGNPFEQITVSKDDSSATKTTVSVAVEHCPTTVVSAVVTAGLRELYDRQQSRRRDPQLRQQPESFFRSIETKENFEKDCALSNALVESLYRGWQTSTLGQYDDYSSTSLNPAVTLFMLGAKLRGRDLARLRESIQDGSLKSVTIFLEDTGPTCFVTSSLRQVMMRENKVRTHDTSREHLSHQSELLRDLDWFREESAEKGTLCPWSLDGHNHINGVKHNIDDTDMVTLVTSDGRNFRAHVSIISAKSEKLASASRFARMQQDSDADNEKVLPVDLSSKNCSWMLQHCYHGSIIVGLSVDKDKLCQDLLELMMVAEEFLCFSLLQECEMRLLHHDQHPCFCWSCARAVRNHADERGVKEVLFFSVGPSCLWSGDSVLDVLALLQHLQGLVGQEEYTIHQVGRPASWMQCLSSHKVWDRQDSTLWSEYGPLASLKMVTISTILSQFPKVVQSEAFYETLDYHDKGDDDTEGLSARRSRAMSDQRILLLQLCLDELSETRTRRLSS